MKREPLDFHAVRPEHQEIHERLCNWARWATSGGRGSRVLPMFRQYRNGYEEATASSSVDSLDAASIERAVVVLPERNRVVLQWAYIRPWVPILAVRRALGLRHNDLHQALQDARSMMKNTVPHPKTRRLPASVFDCSPAES